MTRDIKEAILALLRKAPGQSFTAKKIRDHAVPGTETSTIVEILSVLVDLGEVDATKSDSSPNTQYRISAPRGRPNEVQVAGANATRPEITNKSHAIRQVLIAAGKLMSPTEIHDALDGAIEAPTISALCCSMVTNGMIRRLGSGKQSRYAATLITQRMTAGTRRASVASATPVATKRESAQVASPNQSFDNLLAVIRTTRETLLSAKRQADDALIEAGIRSADPVVREHALVAQQCRESLRALAGASGDDPRP